MGIAAHGANPVTLEQNDGILDLYTLTSQNSPAANELCLRLRAVGAARQGQMGIVELLLILFGRKGAPKVQWLTKQILHYLGLLLESWAAGLVAVEVDPPTSAQTAGARRRSGLGG